MYCSEACRDAHFRHSHNLLCTGPIQQEDHPLIRFKYHALEHTDTLLLAAQVLAHLVNRSRASGGGPEALRGLIAELMVFCHAPFTQACRPPPGRERDVEFVAHTDGLIAEAARLLRAAFEIHAPAEAAVLFEHGPALLSEVLGLFEYNNIDVEVNSMLAPFFASKVQALAASCTSNPQVAAELQAVERLLREKEWMMRCAWGEETTGIYEDDGEAPSGPDSSMTAELDGDAAMGEGDAAAGDLYDPKVSSALMAEVGAEVGRMSLEQLVQAPWPTVHGTALFVTVARINHSCVPNLKIEFHRNSAVLTAIALRPLKAEEELCISYIRQEADVKTRRRQLLEYGFTCSCEKCLQEDSGTVRKTQRRLK